jgi:hypothetical protein
MYSYQIFRIRKILFFCLEGKRSAAKIATLKRARMSENAGKAK